MTPKWKVFNEFGDYVASCKHAEDAAAVLATYGIKACIRWDHPKKNTVFVQGPDGYAGDSYDTCAAKCREGLQRIREREGWI